MFRRRLRRCAKAGSCSRYDPDGTVGMATDELRGMLAAFEKSFAERLENDEQHLLKHAALNRVAVLEGAMQQVVLAAKSCRCGAIRADVVDLITRITEKT